MTPENFCYWLHGYFEIERARQNGSPFGVQPVSITPIQSLVIEEHLNLVFHKVTADDFKPFIINNQAFASC